MSVRLRPRAEADIQAIVLHIADDNPAAARRWYETVRDCCRRIGDMPGLGVSRDDVRAGLRTFPLGNYLILYREIPGGAEIVRIVHGARQWQALL